MQHKNFTTTDVGAISDETLLCTSRRTQYRRSHGGWGRGTQSRGDARDLEDTGAPYHARDDSQADRWHPEFLGHGRPGRPNISKTDGVRIQPHHTLDRWWSGPLHSGAPVRSQCPQIASPSSFPHALNPSPNRNVEHGDPSVFSETKLTWHTQLEVSPSCLPRGRESPPTNFENTPAGQTVDCLPALAPWNTRPPSAP